MTEENTKPKVKFSSRRFKCSYCPARFVRLYHLQRHERLHVRERPFECDCCLLAFTQVEHLKKHQSCLQEHDVYTSSIDCKKCDAKFSNKADLKAHGSHAHPTTDTPSHVCSECGKSFAGDFRLKTHMKSHFNPQRKTCEICNRTFFNGSSLNRHLKVHTKTADFACDVCDRKFSRSDHLKAHLAVHSEKQNFLCNVCSATFFHKRSLDLHLNVAHTDKSFTCYQCYQCSKSFNQKIHLRSHIAAVHDKKRPYSCTKCEMTFARAGALKSHENVHKEKARFVCLKCNASFAEKRRLDNHARIHDRPEPLVCTVKLCGKAPYTSTKPVSVSTKKQQFLTCTECKAKFRYMSNLTTHIRKQH